MNTNLEKKLSGFLIAVLGFCLIAQSASAQAISIEGDLMRWHKVTVELDGPSSSETATPNPFLDYRMDVTFTDGNLTYTVPGYFAADGDAANTSATSGSIWRAHLSPDTVGTWTYTIHFHQGTNVATEGGGTPLAPYDGLTGTFQITETDKTGRDFRGKGRLEYVGEHHLRFKGTGEYFLKVGPDSPENLLAYDDIDNTPNNRGYRKSWAAHEGDWNDGDPTWQGDKGKGLIGAINYLASEEMSTLPFLTMNTPDGDDRNVFPWINTSDYSRLDVSKLAQWGIVFDHATANGLYLHFKMQEQEMDLELDGGALGNERKLYLRELIARFGYHPALNWNIGEENNVDWAGDGAPTVAERIDMIQYIHDTDPYNHLIVVHPAGDPDDLDALFRPLLGSNSELTGLSLQLDKDSKNHKGTAIFDETLKWVNESAAVGKKWVVAVDEAGGARIGASPDFEDPNNQDAARKNTLWGNIMAGGAGMETYFGFRSAYGDLNDEDYRTRDAWWDYCRYAVRFFTDNDVPFQEMSNSNLSSNSNSWTLDKDGDTYVVYLRQGGTTNLDLSGQTGTFSVAWYDPRNGGALQTGSVTSVEAGSGVSLGTAPNNTNEDWVILVQSMDQPPSDNYDLYAHTFDGSGASLNGTTVDVGNETWIADASGASDDGEFTNNSVASLPFQPVDGYIYTLTVTGTHSGIGWIGAGFAKTHSTAELAGNNDGLIWGLTRPVNNNQVAHLNLSGGANNIAMGNDSTNPSAITIVLDTSGGTGLWDVEWFVNGASFHRVDDIDVSFETAVNAVKVNSGYGANTIDSFVLNVSTPSATLLYEHTFDGSASSLNGTSIDIATTGSHGVGTVWSADTDALMDGSFANGAVASLPFIPEDGNVYSLNVSGTYGGSGWIGMGFAQSNATTPLTNNGLIWGLTRPGVGGRPQAAHFNASGGTNFVGDGQNSTNPSTIAIILDTTDGTGLWDVEWFVDGVSFHRIDDIDPAFETGIHTIKLQSGFGANTYNWLELWVD